MNSTEFALHLSHRPGLQERFNALREALNEITRDREIYYVPNPGNAGDGLIRHATVRFLNDAGFSFVEMQRGFSPDWACHCGDAVLIYGGGGAWCRYWDHSVHVVRAAAPLFHSMVVLPSSFETVADVPGVSWFARDRYESLDNQPRANFCDDMTFYLCPVSKGAGRGSADFFRGDAESAGLVPIPPGNVDIAVIRDHLAPPDSLIEAIDCFERIRTDRLHVAILGALLGKDVCLYAGGYFKNRAVYESSMRDMFPNVTFYDSSDLR